MWNNSVLDVLGGIISTIGHDLGHPGYNNNSYINAVNDLALTFNDKSWLENYHNSLLFIFYKNMKIIYLKNIIRKINIRKRMISQILANHGQVVSLMIN